MDQVSNDNKIVTLKDVQKLLGLPPVTSLNEIIISLTSENNELLQILESLYVQGYQAAIIAKQLADRLRKDLLGDSKYLNPSIALRLMSKLIEVPVSHDPEHYLEIILLETIFASKSVKQSNQLITNEMNAKTELAPPVKTVLSSTIEQKITKTEEKSSTQSSLSSGQANPLDLSIWPQVLTALKKKHNTVYSIARMGQPTFSETGHLILVFAFAFHQKRINDVKNRQLLTDTIREITGKNIPIECVFDNQLAKKPTTKSITTMPQNIIDPSLKTISNIFGGGELLES